jgi:hypothetical protein
MRIGVDDCLGYRCLLWVDDLVINIFKNNFKMNKSIRFELRYGQVLRMGN